MDFDKVDYRQLINYTELIKSEKFLIYSWQMFYYLTASLLFPSRSSIRPSLKNEQRGELFAKFHL